ncbi:MAG: SAM-dependent methyltransferase [Pseudonocardia sp.]|nr:SAM-dependent methyltransferase [Pseudonocardia sp.]
MDEVDVEVPQSARIWNYWMGGDDNQPVDRAAGDAWIVVQPEIVPIAKQSRQFLIRAVRYLAAEAGVRQFLDIGAGLPFTPGQNTHEVAQAAAPDARIVYVDNDPQVLARGRSKLVTTDEGVTCYVEADYHNPELIVSDARNILNFTRPVAVMFMGVLGHVGEYERARAIVAPVMDAVPSGSYLVLWENTDTTETARAAAAEYTRSGAVPYRLCTPAQVGGFFDGLELVDPGVVPLNLWRPTAVELGTIEPLDAYAAIGRKQ